MQKKGLRGNDGLAMRTRLAYAADTFARACIGAEDKWTKMVLLMSHHEG